MSVTSIDKDYEGLTLTLTARFDAPIDRVWQLWADPRRLERWWGPPTYPATFEDHELTPGGTVTYFMTGPEGKKYRGWWRVVSVAPPTSLDFVDGFADEAGTPSTDLPTTTVRMRLTEQGGATRMELRSSFDSREHMDQLFAMGMVDGLEQSVGQMDALLVA
jgi:uncharacterized protein YndB with AHSA1/START domain